MSGHVTLLCHSTAGRIGDDSIQVDAEASKQRRKIQNRKNQRARRLRNKGQDPEPDHSLRPFQVRRWRLDDPDEYVTEDASSAAERVNAIQIDRRLVDIYVGASRNGRTKALGEANSHPWLIPPSITFSLSTDHLLHLIQYNVFRGFVSNKRTLNLLLTGWTHPPPGPTTCPIDGPYSDDTTVYPLNPNIPISLAPTRTQQLCPHSIWINMIPFPRIRDNLINRQGSFDQWELLEDLIGELMAMTPIQKRRYPPRSFTVANPSPQTQRDEDEITAGRNGLIVWGEPHDMQSWEATPSFFEKWAWVVEGCDELFESSNRWRSIRGEEPIRFFALNK